MWKDGTEECNGAGCKVIDWVLDHEKTEEVVKSSTGCWTKRRQKRSAVKMWKDGTEECNGAGCKVIDWVLDQRDRRGRLSRCGRMEQKSVMVQVVRSLTGCWTRDDRKVGCQDVEGWMGDRRGRL
ncbi:hypothetical protein J6590_036408 [Homalodisca vitripennis]|nr:hypothetical protein J6590_036408 [Homalodisca vitripennis]